MVGHSIGRADWRVEASGRIGAAMSISGFSGIRELPSTVVGGVTTTYDGHHAISQSIFGGYQFRALFGALQPYGFNGNSWSSNGVPLPNTLSGANAIGMAAHIDSHPAYIAWQRVGGAPTRPTLPPFLAMPIHVARAPRCARTSTRWVTRKSATSDVARPYPRARRAPPRLDNPPRLGYTRPHKNSPRTGSPAPGRTSRDPLQPQGRTRERGSSALMNNKESKK